MTGTLHEDQYKFLSNFVQFHLKWKIFQTKLYKKSKHIYVQ